MRTFINIVTEGTIMEGPRGPEHGAGPVVKPHEAPAILYHGTNFISAAAIVRSGAIDAEEPVDGEELGAVVCLTSDEEMGRNFAIEFVRVNSDKPVGAVFELHGAKVAATHETVPYHAETAGEFEYEYRVMGDLPVRGLVFKVNLVGDVDLLDEDAFLENTWDDMPYHMKAWFGGDMSRFWSAVEKLMLLAGRERVPIESDEEDFDNTDHDEDDDDYV